LENGRLRSIIRILCAYTLNGSGRGVRPDGPGGNRTGAIWALEKRVRNERFHPNTLNKLALALGVEPTELIGEED
jgi:hypothetical protein